MNSTRLHFTAAVLFLLQGGLFSQTVSVEAISRPSSDKVLSFLRAGQIEKYFVSEGDEVHPGDLLVKLDDQAEVAGAERLKAEADTTIRIEAAQAKYEQKKVDLKRIEGAKEKGVATDLEVETARLEVVISKAELDLSMFNNKQELSKYKEAIIQVNQMSITCPFGKGDTKDTTYLVEELMLRTGESVNRLDKVMRVVKIDPLWIDAPVLLNDTRELDLEVGQQAKVYFPGQNTPVTGKIIFIAAVADAASSTRTARVEVPNPGHRPGGEYVKVEFEKDASLTKATTPKENVKEKIIIRITPKEPQKELQQPAAQPDDKKIKL